MKLQLIIPILFCFGIISCDDSQHKTNTSHKIISTMIDELAYPLPPPPPPRTNDTILSMNNEMVDSLSKVLVSIVLDPQLNVINPSILNNIPQEYQELYNSKVVSKKLNLEGISSKKGNKIRLIDSLFIDDRSKYKKTDLLFQFSNVYFDQEYSRALVQVSVSSSNLAGATTIYGLKNIDGNWVIDFSKDLEIS